jgi:N-methylhydantoinase A
MANAIRSRTVQKGIDPRGFSLVAFGGAGPMHGAEVAEQLQVPEVIIPPYPGITSAVGPLTADLKYDLIKTEFQVQGRVNYAKLNADLGAIETQLYDQLRAAGMSEAERRFIRAGDLRYVGQGYELHLTFPSGELDAQTIEALRRDFHTLHEKEYGHVFQDSPIEIVNVRVTAIGVMPKIGKPRVPQPGILTAAIVKTGRGLFRVDHRLETLESVFLCP